MKRICFFHAGCPDGFGAAWSVWRAWGDGARYVPRGHEDAFDPERYQDAQVVFVDISLPNDSLRALGEVAEQVLILDHHRTAKNSFDAEPSLEAWLESCGHEIRFDLSHSGAVLAWQHFHPGEPVPELLRYVEDQDLWRWSLPRSDEVNAAIGSHPRDFATWDRLVETPAAALADEGAPILRANRIEVERALKSAHPISVGNVRAEAVNALHSRAAIGHELAKRAAYGQPFGVVYRVSGTRVDCSIYSTGDTDVSEMAALHGGGGHRNAAGFSVTLEEWLARFL